MRTFAVGAAALLAVAMSTALAGGAGATTIFSVAGVDSASSTCSAGVCTETEQVLVETGIGNPPIDGFNALMSFAFDRFNPALGTLTGVGIQVSASLASSFQLQATDPNDRAFGTVGASLSALLPGLGEGTLISFLLEAVCEGAGCVEQAGNNESASGDLFALLGLSPSLSAFIGTDEFLLHLTTIVAVVPDCFGTCGFLDGTASANFTVTYQYTPAGTVTVPEPSSLALLAGMAGLVLRRRPQPA